MGAGSSGGGRAGDGWASLAGFEISLCGPHVTPALRYTCLLVPTCLWIALEPHFGVILPAGDGLLLRHSMPSSSFGTSKPSPSNKPLKVPEQPKSEVLLWSTTPETVSVESV